MRMKLLVGSLVVLGTTAHPSWAQEQFKIYAAVVDGVSGEPVASLTPQDVTVTEDGLQAKVLSAEPVNWPVKLQLLVDNGQGLGASNIQLLKDGIRGLLDALPEGVEVTLVSTSPQPRTITRATTDRAELLRGLTLLAPDRNVGRFVESMAEATQRIERDKGDALPVIVSVGTSAGDRNVRDGDVNNIFNRLRALPIVVHVVILQGSVAADGGGGAQTEVGLAATKGTGGLYESINAPSRLATLLPEIGARVAETHRIASRQFVLTVERPAGKTGNLGGLGASVGGGKVIKSVSRDGRIQ